VGAGDEDGYAVTNQDVVRPVGVSYVANEGSEMFAELGRSGKQRTA